MPIFGFILNISSLCTKTLKPKRLVLSLTDLVLSLSVQRSVEINDSFSADGEEHLWKFSLQTVHRLTTTPLHLDNKHKNKIDSINIIINIYLNMKINI